MLDIGIQNTIDAMTENVAIVDETGLILYVNKAWDEFRLGNSGHSDKTGKGANYFSAVFAASKKGDEIAQKVETGIQDILSEDISFFEAEYPCHSENKNRWFVANIREIGASSPRLFLFTHKDVSFLVAREKRILEAQRMQAIGQLTGGFAHDFNNLLGIVLGNMELAKQAAAENHRVIEHLNTSITAVEKGSSLVKSLLSFARNQVLKPESIDAIQFIHSTLKLITPVLGEDIDIQLSCDNKPQILTVDSSMLTNAILNIAINARHAMKQGGKLTINLSHVELDGVSFITSEEEAVGSYLLIAITDTGCGINEENLNKVVEPFFTTKEVGEGSGLGLSMVYGFIKQSNGHVNISSRVGHGTTVYLYLPMDGAEIYNENSLSESTLVANEYKTILLVEDNTEILKTITQMLESLGHKVIQAQDGPHALEKLQQNTNNIDIVITDIVMPAGMTGIDLSTKIKSSFPHIKIIMMSGYPLNTFSQSESFSSQHVITKPFSIAELEAEIQKILP